MAQTSLQKRNSRLVQGGTTEVKGNKLGWWERQMFAHSPDDLVITIPSRFDRRPDVLAQEMYGKPQLQWIILQYNNIVDVNVEFAAGKQIRIPTKERVTMDMIGSR